MKKRVYMRGTDYFLRTDGTKTFDISTMNSARTNSLVVKYQWFIIYQLWLKVSLLLPHPKI